jgi:hypothetical protein
VGQNFLKGSNATSATATGAQRATGRSSGRLQPTLTNGEEFALAGPSDLPDPKFNAYRQDLADVALAGRVIASHYAEPIKRTVARGTSLHSSASEDSETVRDLKPGENFELLDDSLGWAWGYAGLERRVGYVKSEAVTDA